MAESKSKVDFPCKAPRLLQVRLPLDQAKMPTQRTTTLEHTGYKYIYIHQKTNIHGTKALIEKKTGQHHPTSPFLICWALYHPLSRVKSNKKSAPGSSGHCQSRLLQCGAFHLHHRILRELGLADINSLEAHHVFGRGKLRWFLWAQETSELQ